MLLCEDCEKEHRGLEHRKTEINEISHTLPQLMTKRLTDAEAFHKNYKSTESGKFFEAYVDFFERVKEASILVRENYDK